MRFLRIANRFAAAFEIRNCRSQKLRQNQSQLLIVALYSQQLAPPGGQLFKNILAGLTLEKIDIFVFVYFILEPREAIHIAV